MLPPPGNNRQQSEQSVPSNMQEGTGGHSDPDSATVSEAGDAPSRRDPAALSAAGAESQETAVKSHLTESN